jgi:predicted anti-sigma-YlaC factor YlaD
MIEQLGDYLDADARVELCRAIEEHLSRCPGCQVFVDTVKKTIVLYQADRQVEVPANVTSRLESALAQEYSRAARSSRD